MLPAAVVALALLAGYMTAIAGSMSGVRAVYLVVVPGLAALGAAFALTRPEPLRFAFLALVAALPLVSFLVPPGRIGLTVFDVATLMLACGLLLRKAFEPREAGAPLFPSRSLALMWPLLIPGVVFAHAPTRSALVLILIFGAYVFFWFALQELRRPYGLERLVSLLSVVAIVVSAGLLVDHFLHLNLSLRGSNPNQLTSSGGRQIWRAGGFFQDPQRAGAFLVSLLAFLLVLAARGRCRGAWLRLLVWGAILAGVPALFLTVSRASILTFLFVCGVVLVAINRWSAVARLAGIAAVLLLAASLVLAPDLWANLMPAALGERLVQSRGALLIRFDIWFDTWEMFADHPLTGIGFGGFQPYLIDTRPMVVNYYGIGAETGVPYVPDQPESGYFKILYESGILGVIAVLLLAGATLRRGIAALAGKAGDPDARTEVIAALTAMAAQAVTFLTLFTTSDPRVLALFAILLAVIWRPSTP